MEANGGSIVSGFPKCLSSHLWACPSVAHGKPWLTRASGVVFHKPPAPANGSYPAQYHRNILVDFQLCQQVKPSRSGGDTRAAHPRFTLHQPGQGRSRPQHFGSRAAFLLELICGASLTQVGGPGLPQLRARLCLFLLCLTLSKEQEASLLPQTHTRRRSG